MLIGSSETNVRDICHREFPTCHKQKFELAQCLSSGFAEWSCEVVVTITIVSHGMIADMESNTRLSAIVTDLLLRGRKLNIWLVFISQSYFKAHKTTRLNANHYFIMKIPNKREIQQTAPNNSSDMDFKDFMKLYKDDSKEPY